MKGQWRDYNPATDYEAVMELQRQMAARFPKRGFTILDPGFRPVLICRVYEVDGHITHAAIGEAQMEVSAFGDGSMPEDFFRGVEERFLEVARYYQMAIARAFVPPELLTKPNGKPTVLAWILKRRHFRRDGNPLAQFYYRVRPAKKQAAPAREEAA